MNEYFRTGPQNLWRQAARVTAPTLAIYGLRDRLVHPDTALRAARTFPDIRVVRLPRIGHVAQMESPAWSRGRRGSTSAGPAPRSGGPRDALIAEAPRPGRNAEAPRLGCH